MILFCKGIVTDCSIYFFLRVCEFDGRFRTIILIRNYREKMFKLDKITVGCQSMYEKRNLLLDWFPPLTALCLIEIPLVVVREFSILETFCQ